MSGGLSICWFCLVVVLIDGIGLSILVPPLFNHVHIFYFPKHISSRNRGPEVAIVELSFLVFFSTIFFREQPCKFILFGRNIPIQGIAN
jgi:hypothetical protein